MALDATTQRMKEKGIDYPFAYVRWTENRNMLAFQVAHTIRSDRHKLSDHPLPEAGRGSQGL